jgi:hypothetical protein
VPASEQPCNLTNSSLTTLLRRAHITLSGDGITLPGVAEAMALLIVLCYQTSSAKTYGTHHECVPGPVTRDDMRLGQFLLSLGMVQKISDLI